MLLLGKRRPKKCVCIFEIFVVEKVNYKILNSCVVFFFDTFLFTKLSYTFRSAHESERKKCLCFACATKHCGDNSVDFALSHDHISAL